MAIVEYLQLSFFIVLVILAAILLLYAVRKPSTTPLPNIGRHEPNTDHWDSLDLTNYRPSSIPPLGREPTLDLSVIVPAYNEEKRLPVMLDECLYYLEDCAQKKNLQYEVVIVSDGSTDKTYEVAQKYSILYTVNKVRVLELTENRGKGSAVRLGMLSARGRKLLFADADGATKFSDYEKLESIMNSMIKHWKNDAFVIGSRAHLEDVAIATRSFFRIFLMRGFHFLVWLFAVRSVRDTQCGFKLMTRATGRKLFRSMHIERWAFDVELLYLAEKLKIPIVEVAVNWKEIEGSKLTPFWSWLQMGIDLFLIWFRYTTGLWKIKTKSHSS